MHSERPVAAKGRRSSAWSLPLFFGIRRNSDMTEDRHDAAAPDFALWREEVRRRTLRAAWPLLWPRKSRATILQYFWVATGSRLTLFWRLANSVLAFLEDNHRSFLVLGNRPGNQLCRETRFRPIFFACEAPRCSGKYSTWAQEAVPPSTRSCARLEKIKPGRLSKQIGLPRDGRPSVIPKPDFLEQ